MIIVQLLAEHPGRRIRADDGEDLGLVVGSPAGLSVGKLRGLLHFLLEFLLQQIFHFFHEKYLFSLLPRGTARLRLGMPKHANRTLPCVKPLHAKKKVVLQVTSKMGIAGDARSRMAQMRAGEAEALLRAAIRKAAVPGLHVRPQLSQLSTLFHLTFLKIFAAVPEQKDRA
ncbi:MAG: hypothetical protein IJL66_08555 [Lachnospiraceae bacterium]|nr:hypothetical protein [Lachnospiraceae bacterium]